MSLINRFIFLMKDEPQKTGIKNNKSAWTIDESKYLCESEYKLLREISTKEKSDIKKVKFNKIRNWFMIELGLNTGLRVAEMANLKHENLLLDNDRSSIQVLGKGNKRRAIWINSEFKKTCHTYIKIKKRFGYSIAEDSFLLININGSQITKRSLQKAFKIIIKKAGLPGHYSIHCLRHTYSTFLLTVSNHNYRFVQQQLGHASIKTTQTYAGVLESEGRKALEKLYK